MGYLFYRVIKGQVEIDPPGTPAVKGNPGDNGGPWVILFYQVGKVPEAN
jgi:hypothetical protein